MNSYDYIEQARRTESPSFQTTNISMLHGAIGIATEAGELLDAFKKACFYNRKLDLRNVTEELGDLFWYMALICGELGISFESIMKANIEKLKKRYPEKFTEDAEQNRDIDAEMNAIDEELK